MPTRDRSLDRSDLHLDPIQQFDIWYKEYLKTSPAEPSAMAIATASREGTPTLRMVLLKGYDPGGFVFFTNYKSAKAQQLASNPKVALAFYWNIHNRQVRVTGHAEKVSESDSDAYFASRPVESQLAAWASHQSEKIESREALEARMSELRSQYKTVKVPRPPHWGGFRIVPEQIEFWQGRANRLHDRFVYSRNKNDWLVERLSP